MPSPATSFPFPFKEDAAASTAVAAAAVTSLAFFSAASGVTASEALVAGGRGVGSASIMAALIVPEGLTVDTTMDILLLEELGVAEPDIADDVIRGTDVTSNDLVVLNAHRGGAGGIAPNLIKRGVPSDNLRA
ncbi:hypothetical protein DFH09DRAFT_1101542 [Mycena vulgaris]|nr:hypothetical protein DFH09DRAFT_1101542 [Mycena vulgaris]